MKKQSANRPLVRLNAIDCCAMWHALAHHPRTMARWAQFEGPFRFLEEIFLTSVSLAFVPTDQLVAMYRSFANAELQRLARKSRNGIQCRHFVLEHRIALNRILDRLIAPVTN